MVNLHKTSHEVTLLPLGVTVAETEVCWLRQVHQQANHVITQCQVIVTIHQDVHEILWVGGGRGEEGREGGREKGEEGRRGERDRGGGRGEGAEGE